LFKFSKLKNSNVKPKTKIKINYLAFMCQIPQGTMERLPFSMALARYSQISNNRTQSI
jgi:hypothetical protein